MTTRADVDSFKQHKLWGEAKEALESWQESKPLTATDRHTVDRSINCLRYLLAFRPIPPALFPSNRIDVAERLLSSVRTLLDTWKDWDENAPMTVAQVADVDASCDQLLTLLQDYRWPPLQKESRAQIYQEAADGYRAIAEQSLSALNDEIADRRAELEELEEQVGVLRADSQQRAAEATAALTAIEEMRETLSENAAEQLQIELGKARSASKDSRDEDHGAFESFFADMRQRAEEAVDGLEVSAQDGRNLLQIVGDQSQAGGYLKFAQREKVGYRLWIGVGVLSVAATVSYLAYEFAQLSRSPEPGLALIIFKSALSVTAIAFSGFCFREAGKRQRQSLDARYRALDLLALRPFTEGMEDDQASLLRGMLGERLFKSPPDEASRRSDEKITTLKIDLGDLKTLGEIAKTAKDVTTN
ncbi:MAG: hypothetical protein PGN24_03690 [Microbacterium arborescens]